MLCTLPDELILVIVKFLKDEDYISLSNANRKLLSLLASEKRFVLIQPLIIIFFYLMTCYFQFQLNQYFII